MLNPQTAMLNVIFLCLLSGSLINYVSSQCTFPEILADKTWRDSYKGDVTFGQTLMTGFDIRFMGCYVIDKWECYFTESLENGTYLILRSRYTYTTLQLRAYLCVEITKITDYSYYYYFASGQNLNFNYDRVIEKDDAAVVSDAKSELCVNTTNDDYPHEKEYHVLVRKGFEANARQDCFYDLKGIYSYEIVNRDTSESFCNTGNETWDICSDPQRMTFDYSVCPITIANSESGQVFCIFSKNIGMWFIQTVYSEDRSTGAVKFTCLFGRRILVNSGVFVGLQSTDSCFEDQFPYKSPTHPNSTVIGINFVLQAKNGDCDTVKSTTDVSECCLFVQSLMFCVFLAFKGF